MAKLPDLEMNMKAFDEWVASRPPVVQDLCRRFPPDRLYRIKSSGHRCTLVSYSEDGTMKVNVTGQFNFLTFDRQVFGIKRRVSPGRAGPQPAAASSPPYLRMPVAAVGVHSVPQESKLK